MHSYASDSLDRSIVPWVIAGISVCIAYVYSKLSVLLCLTIPWWMESPSILGVYGILHWLYDHHLWKLTFCRVRLSQIPNCNGTWYGLINSTHNGGEETEGMLAIHQTWSKILVEFKSSTSESFSRMASFNVCPGVSTGLIYEYANDPKIHAKQDMHAHRGLSFIKLNQSRTTLEGDYYTGRDRCTQGTLQMRLVSSKILDRVDAARRHNQLQQYPETTKEY